MELPPLMCEEGEHVDGAIDVQGRVVFHSMNRLASEQTGTAIDTTALLAEVVDMQTFSAAAQLDLAGEACETAIMGSCSFCFTDIPVTTDTAGLGVAIRDGRTGDRKWITTLQEAGTAERLADLQAETAPLDTAVGFAVTRDALDTVIAPLTGLSGDELMERGVIFGLVYANTANGERGVPLAGAVVTANDSDVIVIHPGSKLSGVGSATNQQGIFPAIPREPGVLATTFTVTPPEGASQTWNVDQVGRFVPDTMYFQVMHTVD